MGSGGLELQNFQRTQNLIRNKKLKINRETRHFLYTLLVAGLLTNKIEWNKFIIGLDCQFFGFLPQLEV